MPVKIFFCYAHEDEALLIRLKAHLKPLERQGLIETWYDREIDAGSAWEQEISQRLSTAQIILLLVSPDFMNSEYCYGTELKRALERHSRGEVQVIPVIGRPVYWQGMLGQLQALPKDALPITDPNWHDQDRALHNVTESLRKIVDLTLSHQKNLEGKAQRFVSPVQNLASPPTSAPLPNALNELLNLLMAEPQSSPQLSGTTTPSFAASSLFEEQRETEMFEKDMIFEEYISKRVQQNTIPSTWHIYQQSSKSITRYGIRLSFVTGGSFAGVTLGLIIALAFSTPNWSPITLLLTLPIALLAGGLSYPIHKRHELAKKQLLVLTPNGCICFQNESPRYIIRYNSVMLINNFSSSKMLEITTTNFLHFKINLNDFENPELIAQHIDSAYTLFETNHRY